MHTERLPPVGHLHAPGCSLGPPKPAATSHAAQHSGRTGCTLCLPFLSLSIVPAQALCCSPSRSLSFCTAEWRPGCRHQGAPHREVCHSLVGMGMGVDGSEGGCFLFDYKYFLCVNNTFPLESVRSQLHAENACILGVRCDDWWQLYAVI